METKKTGISNHFKKQKAEDTFWIYKFIHRKNEQKQGEKGKTPKNKNKMYNTREKKENSHRKRKNTKIKNKKKINNAWIIRKKRNKIHKKGNKNDKKEIYIWNNATHVIAIPCEKSIEKGKTPKKQEKDVKYKGKKGKTHKKRKNTKTKNKKKIHNAWIIREKKEQNT